MRSAFRILFKARLAGPDFILALAARFCEFFWDPQLKVLEKIGEKVRVKSEDEIWSISLSGIGA